MAAVLKQARIGLAGGRRVGLDEMANDEKSREELEELLVLMEAIEEADDASSADECAPADKAPKVKPAP